MLSKNLEELNKKLVDLHKQCEEFQEHNAQLMLSNQQNEEKIQLLNQQLQSSMRIDEIYLSQTHHTEDNSTVEVRQRFFIEIQL